MITGFGVHDRTDRPFTITGARNHGIELAFKPLAVVATGAFGERMPPPGQHKGAQQQRLHTRCEDRIARLDRELAIAQLVRQANLPVFG